MNNCDPQRIAGIETYDINNGIGFGVTLFVQGCTHHCKGCHNPTTWAFDGGHVCTEGAIAKLFQVLADPNIVRLTISGGEPFDNVLFVLAVCVLFKKLFPQKQLWVYTGYTYESLSGNPLADTLLQITDVLVDGPFELDKRDLSLAFRGSNNQRLVDVQRSLKEGGVVPFEIHFDDVESD